jgi:hypothetical protein
MNSYKNEETVPVSQKSESYPVKFDVEYPKKLDRLTSFFRIILVIPAVILVTLLTGSSSREYVNEVGKHVKDDSGGVVVGLFLVTALMILFRQKYPRWWFDFALELNRFSARVSAYFLLLTDKYPSTDDEQAVKLYIKYPDAKKDLRRWLPLFKWILAIPHYIVLLFLVLGALVVTIIAWLAILIMGEYPKGLFNYVVGVLRWAQRVNAYAFLLTTDFYPPFSLK